MVVVWAGLLLCCSGVTAPGPAPLLATSYQDLLGLYRREQQLVSKLQILASALQQVQPLQCNDVLLLISHYFDAKLQVHPPPQPGPPPDPSEDEVGLAGEEDLQAGAAGLIHIQVPSLYAD